MKEVSPGVPPGAATGAQLMRMPKHDLIHRIRIAEDRVEKLKSEVKGHVLAHKELIDTLNDRNQRLRNDHDKLGYDFREMRDQRDVYWALLRKLVGK